MSVLLWSVIIVCVAFAIHLAWWRIALPVRQTKWLLIIFFGTMAAVEALLYALHTFGISVFHAPHGLPEYLHITLFVIAVTLAYMITYSAIEADSPSLVMVMSIARTGSQGLEKEAFYGMMTDDLLIKPRIRDLLTDQMAVLDRDTYRLTPKGVLFARIFILYRKLLKAQKGG